MKSYLIVIFNWFHELNSLHTFVLKGSNLYYCLHILIFKISRTKENVILKFDSYKRSILSIYFGFSLFPVL